MSNTERTLVEAGAGCGKTTSIIEKFKSALSSKKDGGKAYLPESCVLLTFTDAAAREMRARIKKKYPEVPLTSSFVGTFHSYCLHLLSNARLVGDAKILSDSELTLLIKEEFIRCVSEEPELSTLLSYLDLQGILDQVLWGSDNSKKLHGEFESLENTWKSFEKALTRSLNSLDLEELDSGDWPHQALKLLEEKDLQAQIKLSQKKALKQISQSNPKLLRQVKELRELQEKEILTPLLGDFKKEEAIFAFLAQKLSDLRAKMPSYLTFSEIEKRCLQGLRDGTIKKSQLSLIIVDEFQDTSPEQWEIIELLSSPETDWYLVGDPKQSIYAFRKADIRLYKKLKSEVTVAELSTNYRSSASVLAATNKMQEISFQSPLKTESNSLDPDPQTLLPGAKYESLAETVVISEFEEWHPEFLLERIQARHTETPDKHHAVLFREWKKLYTFADYLIQKEVPFQIQGSENYLDHFLTHAFLDSLPNVEDYLSYFYEFCHLKEPLRWPQGAQWIAAMERLLIDLSQKDIRGWQKIAQLLQSGTSAQKLVVPAKNLKNTLELSLLTIHGSKGLEFDFVYLPDPRERASYKDQFEDNEIPFKYAVGPQTKSRSLYYELQKIDRSFRLESEQKRLFYVAVTRAKLGLDFFIPKERSTRPASDDPSWWEIWREGGQLKRFRWSEVLRSLPEMEFLSFREVPLRKDHTDDLFIEALPLQTKTPLEKKTNKNLRSDFQIWGESLHSILEHWNGELSQLNELTETLPLSLKDDIHTTVQELRKSKDLTLYWESLTGKNDWMVFREEALIEQTEEEEKFGYADVLMLKKDEAIILDWKSSLREDLLTRPERIEKIQKQLENYAKTLKYKIKKVKVIAIGIFRNPSGDKVKKILEKDL